MAQKRLSVIILPKSFSTPSCDMAILLKEQLSQNGQNAAKTAANHIYGAKRVPKGCFVYLQLVRDFLTEKSCPEWDTLSGVGQLMTAGAFMYCLTAIIPYNII